MTQSPRCCSTDSPPSWGCWLPLLLLAAAQMLAIYNKTYGRVGIEFEGSLAILLNDSPPHRT